MLNGDRPPFEKESMCFSVTVEFDMILKYFDHSKHEFSDTLDDLTLAVALIGASDNIYCAVLYGYMSIERRKRILKIISQSHDVTLEDMEVAQLLIYDEAIKWERAYNARNHIFSEYDVDELGDIEYLAIPDGIIEIEDYAFYNYAGERNYRLVAEERMAGWWDRIVKPGFHTVVFPDSLKRIGEGAFSEMICLKNIHFGNSLEHIGTEAFACCGVEKIELPGSIKYIGESAFYYCFNLKSVKLSEGIEVIPDMMFFHCHNLREVILPSTIKEIGKYAFLGCFDLERIKLPEGLTVIAEGLFADCGSLKEIYIPKSGTQIEDNAFGSCLYDSCEEDLVIICHRDSFAHQFAIENNLKFNLVTV